MTTVRSHPNPQLERWKMPEGGPNFPYRIMRRFFQVTVGMLGKVRVFNRHYEPASGSVVYISNHQSFLDPMLMSMALRRPMNYMARDTLFRSPVFRWMITTVNAFPVKRGTADLAAIKEAMRRLKAGGQVVIFAEGTRTRDGRIGRLFPGVSMLAQRLADWTVPVVIDGAFEAWPRTQRLPSPGNIVVQYGKPMPRAEVQNYSPEELMRLMHDRLVAIQSELRRRVGRPALTYEQEPSGEPRRNLAADTEKSI